MGRNGLFILAKLTFHGRLCTDLPHRADDLWFKNRFEIEGGLSLTDGSGVSLAAFILKAKPGIQQAHA